jgi:streptomycin 6-kinase
VKIQEIIQELHKQGVINHRCKGFKELSGGTSSLVFVLLEGNSPKYVVKLNNNLTIKYESEYLKFYSNIGLLPKLLYVDKEYIYLVYSFKSGQTKYERGNKRNILKPLVKSLINFYQPISTFYGYGYVDEPANSWTEFLIHRAMEAREVIATTLAEEDHIFVHSLINFMDVGELKYLLHGDCGMHNFLFSEGLLVGVIDPTPVIGEPLYDLIYAFCSSSDNLDIATIQNAVHLLDSKFIYQRNLNEEVLIGLYFRIATCIRHHPNDLKEYLKWWDYWKKRVS